MLAIWIINVLVVAGAVLIHYEALYRLNIWCPKLPIRHRYRVVAGVLGALMAHCIEVWLFALAYYFLLSLEGFGGLTGAFNGSLMDCAYFSFTAYTSLGLGDISPSGDIRFLVGLEPLAGLVLITWTASFMFIEMHRDWDDS
ncbi:MAG: ion channel [Pseudomonadales bacterium]